MQFRSLARHQRHITNGVLLLASIGTVTFLGCRAQRPAMVAVPAPAEQVQREQLRRIDALLASLAQLDTALQAEEHSTVVHSRFFAARTGYKQVEPLVELYLPTTADLINGPALDDMAEDDPLKVLPPEGFQVLEESLFPTPQLASASARAEAREEVRILMANVRRAREDAEATPLSDAAVFDAARLQLVRLYVLGLAGFDSPIAARSLPEAADALAGVRTLLTPYTSSLTTANPTLATALSAQFAAAEQALRTADRGLEGFETFDRLQFFTQHLRPLTSTLLQAQQALGVANPPETRAWRASAASPFEGNAFDAMFFAPTQRRATSVDEVALGETLFRDPVLSSRGTRACATCHQPGRAFQDGKPTSLPGRGAAPAARRNAPTLLNSALQNAHFDDLRSISLEDQITAVVGNHEEMHVSLDSAAASVSRRPDLVNRFAVTYGADRVTAVTPARLRDALAAYLRSLASLNAPFDRAIRGDTLAMTDDARRGYTVFMGKGKCGTCHFAPLFNGSVPPLYQKTESEVIGVPSRPVVRGATIDADRGRAAITGLSIHEHAFKTPTLRNVGQTAPYMHNGVYRTLDEVIEFYNRGGGAGIGAALPNQTLPTDPLHLTGREKQQLVAFLHALTDTSRSSGR